MGTNARVKAAASRLVASTESAVDELGDLADDMGNGMDRYTRHRVRSIANVLGPAASALDYELDRDIVDAQAVMRWVAIITASLTFAAGLVELGTAVATAADDAIDCREEIEELLEDSAPSLGGGIHFSRWITDSIPQGHLQNIADALLEGRSTPDEAADRLVSLMLHSGGQRITWQTDDSGAIRFQTGGPKGRPSPDATEPPS